MSKTRTVPTVDRAAKNAAIAAGLFGLSAVLNGVWMLTRTNPNTTSDWVTLVLTVAAAMGLGINAARARRASASSRDGQQDR